jgi:predicted transcriptional regulator
MTNYIQARPIIPKESLLTLVRLNPGCTSTELAKKVGANPGTFSSRLCKLGKTGEIEIKDGPGMRTVVPAHR